MLLRRYEDRALGIVRASHLGHRGLEEQTALIEDCTRMPALERTILLGQLLARETREEGVWEALAEHAAAVSRAWAGGCMIADGAGWLRAGAASTYANSSTALPLLALEPGAELAMAQFGGPFAFALHRRSDATGSGAARSLRFLFRDERVGRAALATVGERGLLIVVERRERELQPDDWYRLRVIADQACSALRRIAAAS